MLQSPNFLCIPVLCASVLALPAWAVGSDLNQTEEKPQNTHAAYANAMGKQTTTPAPAAAATPAPVKKAAAPKRQLQAKAQKAAPSPAAVPAPASK